MPNRLGTIAAFVALLGGGALCSLEASAQALDTLDAIAPYIDACVIKRLEGAGFSAERDVTFRLAFRRDGTIIGTPQTAYSRPAKEEPEQARFITTVVRAITDCTPLPFSKPLGASIAGRIFTFRYTVTSQKGENI
jgi:hypothetical protein